MSLDLVEVASTVVFDARVSSSHPLRQSSVS